MLVGVWVLLTWAAATPALAGPSRADGMLAVAPLTGSGIVLVNADGTGQHRICAAGQRCGRAGDPSWSPDGRELMFTDPRIRIVYPDGSCLDCEFGVAADPAFKPDGTQITYVKNQTLLQDGIDRVFDGTVDHVTGSDAVWSARGELAVVRRGRILVGAPTTLKPLATGSQPSWSPGGGQIAAVQNRWIVVITVGTGRVRRIVRGSAPAFAPDGRRIAYVAPDHRLMIVSSTGSPRPTPVSHIKARSVAWQPRPAATPARCQAPPGSTVLARSPAAIITGDDQAPEVGQGDVNAVMGCLTATGRERLLAYAGAADGYDLTDYGFGALAAPYVALKRSDADEHYGGVSVTVEVFDLRTGRQDAALGGETAGCGTFGCTPGLRDLVIDSAGATAAATWLTEPVGALTDPLAELGCAPDGSVCVTSGAGDYSVFAAASPAAGSNSAAGSGAFTSGPSPWQPTTLPAISGTIEFSGAQGLACPSSTLCVAIGASDVWTISSGGSWIGSNLGTDPIPSLNSLTCPSTSLCLAAGDNGKVGVSTAPAGGAPAWQIEQIDAHAILSGPACDPAGTCSVDSPQGVWVASDPASGTSAWQIASGAPEYEAESCPTSTLCALITGADQISTATAPGAGAQAAQTLPSVSGALKDVSCPTASFCAAISTGDTLLTSTDPAGGSWTASTLPVSIPLEAIDCTSATACLITDSEGQVLTSTNPAGGAAAWTTTLVDGNPCNVSTTCSDEPIQANGGSGESTVATSTISGTGPYVGDLTLTGEVLSWEQDGTPEKVTLTR